MPGLYRHVVW